MSSVPDDSDLRRNAGFWASWRLPPSVLTPLPPPTFDEWAQFFAEESRRFRALAVAATTPYEIGRAQYRAALALTKSDECARIAIAERAFA